MLPLAQLYDTAPSVTLLPAHRRSSFPGPAAMYPAMAAADADAFRDNSPAAAAAARAAQQQAIAVAESVARALEKQQRAAAKPGAASAEGLGFAAAPAAKPWSALKLQQAAAPAAEGEPMRVCQLCRRSKRPHAYSADASQPDGLAARCK